MEDRITLKMLMMLAAGLMIALALLIYAGDRERAEDTLLIMTQEQYEDISEKLGTKNPYQIARYFEAHANEYNNQ